MANPNPYQTPESAAEPGSTQSSAARWLLPIIFTVTHLLLVGLAYAYTAPNMWIMEGGSESPSELIAGRILMLLNFPVGLLGVYAAYATASAYVLGGFVLANSCLWGIGSAKLARALFRKR